MSDFRKTLKKLDEMTAGATGGGAIAPSMCCGNGFANGGPGTKKRLEEKDETPKIETPSAFGMWANSPSKTAKQTKVKSMKVVESKKKIDEADLEEEKLDPKNKKPKIDAIGKKKPDHRDIGKKPQDKEILPKELNESVDEAEAALKKVRNITSGIKHGVDPREIMTAVQQLATQYGVDVNSEMGDVYDAMKALHAAVYGLDEPFEYAVMRAQEENEPLDEISDKLRNKYVDRATSDYGHANFAARSSKSHKGLEDYSKEQEHRAKKRAKGLGRALSDKRLGRKEVDESASNEMLSLKDAIQFLKKIGATDVQPGGKTLYFITPTKKASGVSLKLDGKGNRFAAIKDLNVAYRKGKGIEQVSVDESPDGMSQNTKMFWENNKGKK